MDKVSGSAGTSAGCEQVLELLKKQRRIEGMVHSQSMPRQAMVEVLVQRQHLAELQQLLQHIEAQEIGNLLDSLPLPDAQLLWDQIAPERQNDVLWELSDARRLALAGEREPAFNESQMNAFVLNDGRLRQIPIEGRKNLVDVHPLWIDLLAASRAERRFVGSHFALELPDPDDVTDLEVTSRYQIDENGQIRLNASFLLDREGQSRSVPVTFIVHRGTLFTLRNQELPVFRLQRRRARTQVGYVTDCTDVLLDLLGADVEYSADSLEDIYATLGKVGRQVLSETISDHEAAAILGDIAEEEDLNGRIRGNILDTQRAINFLLRSKTLTPVQVEDARQILRNIDSLNSHTSFLFDKINFLMDATIGFININQNKRINQLTVFGVVFTPINILAGIGGMSEFSMMTQGIPWPIAYGGFLLCAALVGVLTFTALRWAERRHIRRRLAGSPAQSR